MNPVTDPTRIRLLKAGAFRRKKRYVLYWMQQAQRVYFNHALDYAMELANAMASPLVVVFGLYSEYPEANSRHFTFMVQGLKETQDHLKGLGIQMEVYPGHPAEVAIEAAKDAILAVCDRGYMPHQVMWRQRFAASAPCRVVEVESDAVVPVDVSSEKAEYAARTLRPKILRALPRYLKPVPLRDIRCASQDLMPAGLDLSNPAPFLKREDSSGEVPPVSSFFTGGYNEARRRLDHFQRRKLNEYKRLHNQPQTDGTSTLSPYLHFGQISPLEIALAVHLSDAEPEPREAFLEQLIVRRELAINSMNRNPSCGSWHGLPHWCRETLLEHQDDKREKVYTQEELIAAKTHDDYWNAAMKEMIHTGYMHNYMRMYWGKKILEWSRSPEKAFHTALYLNNRFFLDGRDPNSTVGVSWIFGLHDRPWKERNIFGKIRYMAASGLERKCDIKAYVNNIEGLVKKPPSP